jgi:hypothetical protein
VREGGDRTAIEELADHIKEEIRFEPDVPDRSSVAAARAARD